MNPPPPMPQDCGRATPSAKTVDTAASMAFPPCSSTSRPTAAAAGDSVATTPYGLVTPGWNRDPSVALEVVGISARRPHSMAARRHDRMPDRYPVHVRSSPLWLVLGRGACLPRAGTIDSGGTGSEDAAMEQPFQEG